MSDNLIATVKTPKGDLQFDYESMANKPKKFTAINVNNVQISPTVENDKFSFTASKDILLTSDCENKTINIDIDIHNNLVNDAYNIIWPNLVSNEIKNIYGLNSSSDINDIFRVLEDVISKKIIGVTVMTKGGFPIEGASITVGRGIFTTNKNGYAPCSCNYEDTKLTFTIKCSSTYKDVVENTVIDYDVKADVYQSLNVYVERSTASFMSGTSTSITFSPDVAELSISCAGGGGGGGGGAESNYHNEEEHTWSYSGGGGGGGGGGGYVANETVKLEEKENIVHVVVGAGGSGGASVFYNYHTDKKIHYSGPALSGKDGGESYVTLNDANDIKYAVAAGGKGGAGGYATTSNPNGGRAGEGGAGNGIGGTGSVYGIEEDDDGDYHYVYNRPSDGKNATEILGDTDIKVGGGGAGGSGNDTYTASGGLPYGGSLVKIDYDDYYDIESRSGTGYAGGGAGGLGGMSHENGADGHSGVVAITWKFRDEITEDKPEEETPAE